MQIPKNEKEKKIDFDAVEYIDPPKEPIADNTASLGLDKPTIDKNLATRTPRGKLRQITVAASVFSYQNKGGDVDVILTGGTSVSIQFSRDNITKITIPNTPLRLSQGDWIHITHSGAPTMYLIPR